MSMRTARDGAPARCLRRWVMHLARVSVLATMTGCADLLVDNYRYGTVSVEAVTNLGVPVPGVRMILHRGGEHLDFGTTDQDGVHVFTYVPFGALGIYATIPDPFATPDRRPVIIIEQLMMEEGVRQDLVFDLIRCGSTVQVRVIDDTGGPVADVAVDVYRSTGVLTQGHTDEEGLAEFTDLPCGSIGVAIAPPPGYTASEGPGGSYVDGLAAGEDDVFEVEFELVRS